MYAKPISSVYLVQSKGLAPGFWCYFGLLFGGMALAIAVFSYAFYQEEVKTERQHTMTRDLHHVEIQQAILNDTLVIAFDALIFIADQVHLHQPFSHQKGQWQLGADFISFLRTIPAFDQVRLLDMRGREVIRANQSQTGPHLAAKSELQDKSSRYYFRDAIRLARGQPYISSLDLNVEHGEVERPLKPVIRLAMPVFEGEAKSGVVVLNLKMANVLARIQQVNHTGESKGYLLNTDGFFLSSPHTEWNWGFILPGRNNQSFAAKFPRVWQHISDRDRGQFEADGDMFSFATINPLQALEKRMDFSVGDDISRHRWFIVSRLPAADFARIIAPERRAYLSITAILMLVAILLAGILAWLHTQKTQARLALAESEAKFRDLANKSLVGFYLVQDEVFKYVNPKLAEIFHCTEEELVGHIGPKKLVVEDDWPVVAKNLSRRLKGNVKSIHYSFRGITRDQKIIEVEAFGSSTSYQGKPAVIGMLLDISERKQAEEKIESALREKEVLLREIHHRVKNNMQIVSSLLKLQASHVEDVRLQEICRDSQNRIRAMSMVHEQLYASAEMGAVRAQGYLENVVFSLVRSYSVSAQRIAVQVDAGGIFLNMDESIPCGLIVNELVSNAMKHAFADKNGEIKVSLTMPDDEHRLLGVYDNGCGLPLDLDIRETKTLGLQLVDTLAEQLGGELTINCEHGTNVRILFPADEEKNT